MDCVWKNDYSISGANGVASLINKQLKVALINNNNFYIVV